LFNVSIASKLGQRVLHSYPDTPKESLLQFIYFSDPPGQPQIEGYRNKQPLKKGDTVTLVCISRGGNPLATITWYRNGQRVDSSYTTILNGSKNTYEFTATEEDNNALYSCQAKNDLIVKPLEAEITTIVQCKWLKELLLKMYYL
jgi:hypothetical protein